MDQGGGVGWGGVHTSHASTHGPPGLWSTHAHTSTHAPGVSPKMLFSFLHGNSCDMGNVLALCIWAGFLMCSVLASAKFQIIF